MFIPSCSAKPRTSRGQRPLLVLMAAVADFGVFRQDLIVLFGLRVVVQPQNGVVHSRRVLLSVSALRLVMALRVLLRRLEVVLGLERL